MKLDAHPLVVAVALGLLGPQALEAVDEDDPTAESSDPADEPDTEEFERVAHEWTTVPR